MTSGSSNSPLGIGLIGTGFMGKAHAIAYHSAPTVFGLGDCLRLSLLADVDLAVAQAKAREFGFDRASDDWRTLVRDAEVDVVDICSPNHLHKQMALAAIAAGKAVFAEKPLALNASDALEMTLAAEAAGVKTLVGFNYAKNPAAQLAREIIQAGEIGEVVHFRGTHNEDYLADPASPHSWRLQRAYSGSGALGDMGSHIINMAHYLVGDISAVCGDLQTVIRQRPLPTQPDRYAEVENEDQAHCLVRFANGAQGTLETSRIAWGRKMGLTFEVTGSKGSLVFDQERMSELRLFSAADASNRSGFRTLLIGPEHPDYGYFCVGPGHGVGYNDQKAIEVRDLVEALLHDKPLWPDFRAAYEVNRVIDAIEQSHHEGVWVGL